MFKVWPPVDFFAITGMLVIRAKLSTGRNESFTTLVQLNNQRNPSRASGSSRPQQRQPGSPR